MNFLKKFSWSDYVVAILIATTIFIAMRVSTDTLVEALALAGFALGFAALVIALGNDSRIDKLE